MSTIYNYQTQGDPVVWIPFSEYELRNLASFLAAVFPDRVPDRPASIQPHPFGVFNSGDWIAVADRFFDAHRRFAHSAPGNRSPEEYRAAVMVKIGLPSEPYWRGLLRTYIAHIVDREGIDYLGVQAPSSWSVADREQLERVAEEARVQAR